MKKIILSEGQTELYLQKCKEMKRLFQFFVLSISFFCVFAGKGVAQQREYIELSVYHAGDTTQLRQLNNFLQNAYVPALHKSGIDRVGVFTVIGNDTAADKKFYVVVPYSSLKQKETINKKIEKDVAYQNAAGDFISAPHDKAPYKRFERIFLKSFEFMSKIEKSGLTGSKGNRVYELRSYESATEKIFKNKVRMFNQGGEIALFQRLRFNAIFYGEVIFGSKMPNLMYMTSFENKAARDEHWKTFGNDPEWKKLSSLPEYQNNVSKIEIVYLTPADYSDL